MKKLLMSLGSAGVLGVGSMAMGGSASAAGDPNSGAQLNSDYTESHAGNAKNKTDWRGQKTGHNSLQSRIDQAVANGQLTSDQRSAILAEINQLRTSLKDTSADDRRATTQNMHSQLEAWAQQNEIPLQFVAGHHQTN